LIINASGSTEQAIPDGGPLVQRQLGLGESGIACMSIHATCLSFLVALDTAASLIATGRYARVLITSSEIASRALNFEHLESSTLFGDGAAAVVAVRTPDGEASCIHAARLETYGEGAYLTQVAGGGTRKHPNHPDTRPEDNLFFMDGPAVFKLAVRYAPAFLESLRPGLSTGLGSIKLAIPHQASRLALEAHRFFGFKRHQIARTIDHYGNVIAASIPLTLYESVREGKVVRGDEIILLGTGAGLSIGGMILTY
jgi:3-oxoacyl-[acyl-carrier-protein] synthase-3